MRGSALEGGTKNDEKDAEGESGGGEHVLCAYVRRCAHDLFHPTPPPRPAPDYAQI